MSYTSIFVFLALVIMSLMIYLTACMMSIATTTRDKEDVWIYQIQNTSVFFAAFFAIYSIVGFAIETVNDTVASIVVNCIASMIFLLINREISQHLATAMVEWRKLQASS